MRTFVIKLNHPLERIELNNLTKDRTDLVARCVNAALWLDRDIRRDVVVYFCFSNSRCLRIDGHIRGMNPDERSIAGFLVGIAGGKTYPGLELTEQGFDGLVASFTKDDVYYLDRSGDDIASVPIRGNPVFVLGDDVGLEPPADAKKVSIGPNSYLTSHCIVMLNTFLDRHGG